MTSARGDISPGNMGRSAKRRPSRANTKSPQKRVADVLSAISRFSDSLLIAIRRT
jgi:hypothetical protein